MSKMEVSCSRSKGCRSVSNEERDQRQVKGLPLFHSTRLTLCHPCLSAIFMTMPAKKDKNKPLVGTALVKEVNRRIRVARKLWDAHNNSGCRKERLRALELYNTLSEGEKDKVPQELRVWLRYRSEKYFGDDRKGNGANSKG